MDNSVIHTYMPYFAYNWIKFSKGAIYTSVNKNLRIFVGQGTTFIIKKNTPKLNIRL